MKCRKLLVAFSFVLLLPLCLNAKTVKVGYYMDSGNFMSGMSEADPKFGYAYEYLQKIASYTGWTYEYKYGYFDELYSALLAGEIDILGDISYTPERAKLVNYSDYPMGTETYYLYARSDDASVSADDLSTINGKTLALDNDSFQQAAFLQWMETHDVHPKITFMKYDDILDSDFDDGVYDLYLSIDIVAKNDWEPIAKIGSSDIYLVVNRHRSDVIKELNAAQNSIYMTNPYYNNNLWAKYFSNPTNSKRLSSKETEWLANHPKITVGCLKDDFPYACKNSKNEISGLITFFINKIQDTFGISDDAFEYHFFDSHEDLEEALHSGKIDLTFPLCFDLYIAEQNGEILSPPVQYSSLQLVRSSKSAGLEDSSIIGVISGSRTKKYLQEITGLKNNVFVEYQSDKDCLNAVLDGEISGAILSNSVIQNNFYFHRKYKKTFCHGFV